MPCYLQYGQLRLQWRAACERVGVRGVTIHDLRHVCGQTAADAGARIESIQAQLGHATAEMALRYARRRELKDSSENLGHMVVPYLRPPIVGRKPRAQSRRREVRLPLQIRFASKKQNGAQD